MTVTPGSHKSIIRGGQWPENDLVAAASAGWWVTLGTYTAELICEDNTYDCVISGSVYVPEINFVGTPVRGVSPLVVNFTDTTTYPVGFSGVWRSWNFGDPYGTNNILSGSGLYETTQHVYPTNGRYNVTIQVKMCKI